MGTWGEGNFENDYAAGFLDKLLRQLIHQVENCLDVSFHKNSDNMLVCGEEKLMPSVDIICALIEHYGFSPIVESVEVIRWKSAYLTIFDENIMATGPKPDYVIKRRVVIEQTFDRLYQLAVEGEKP